MNRTLIVLLVCLVCGQTGVAAGTYDLDRTGSFHIAPRFGFSYPAGVLSDANYNTGAASWRKEGVTISGEFGYYLSNSTVFGLEASYSNFPPKDLGTFADPELDQSRVRIRRFAMYLKYQMVPRGAFRPFLKLSVGYFDASRINMPQPETDPVEYKEYSLGAKPAFSGGAGIVWYISRPFSLELAVEAISLNSFSSSWETSGGVLGPLRSNMLFFPVYFGLSFHFGG